MSIKALSIHPEVGGSNVTVEAGQPIKGMVKLTLSKPVPDIRVTVTFYGEKQATWLEDGDPARPYTVSMCYFDTPTVSPKLVAYCCSQVQNPSSQKQ